MSLLYKDEHLVCVHYLKNDPPIKIFDFKKGDSFDEEVHNRSQLLFLITGKISVSYNGFINKIIGTNQVILLPTGCSLKSKILEDSHFITFAFDVQVQLCANFSMLQLYPYYEDVESAFCPLDFNEQLTLFIKLMEHYIRDGINCMHLYEIKKQELFYVLRAYYSKELLAAFFYPVLDKEDIHFKKFILDNCLSVKSVSELATMASYSTSGFIKKFTRSFADSPYRWISQYKADRILQDIHSGEKSFKQICNDYDFSSMPHFIEFCKKQYGSTPGKMRKKSDKS